MAAASLEQTLGQIAADFALMEEYAGTRQEYFNRQVTRLVWIASCAYTARLRWM